MRRNQNTGMTPNEDKEADEETSLMSEPTTLVECRRGWFRYKNPVEWNFSLFNICHILKNILDYLRYFFLHKSSKPNSTDLKKHLPKADKAQLNKLRYPPEKGIQVLWIGHASLLVQIDGVNILTDPVFHDCGPSFFGWRYLNYKRFRPPAVTVDELKNTYNLKIDVVVISHDHFDHLDDESISELVDAYGEGIEWYVPQNMKRWFSARNCKKVNDLMWWQKSTSNHGLTVTCTPAKHWCGRNLRYYYCRHLWCSWYIEGPKGSRFFFAGDTGYASKLYPSIKHKYGPPDLAAIPIGACKPRAVMEAQHIDPGEAMKIHRELAAKNSIAIHWGTYAMSNEKIHEPKEDLKSATCEREDETFVTMDHGEVKLFVTDDNTDVSNEDGGPDHED